MHLVGFIIRNHVTDFVIINTGKIIHTRMDTESSPSMQKITMLVIFRHNHHPTPHKQSGGRETFLLYHHQYIYVVDSHQLLLAKITLLHHQTSEDELMRSVSHISFHFTYRWPCSKIELSFKINGTYNKLCQHLVVH